MRSISRWFFLHAVAAILVAVGTVAADAEERRVPSARDEVLLSYAPVVKRAAPAVVNIFSTRMVSARRTVPPLFDDPFFRRFFGEDFPRGVPRTRVQNSLGSGVIVREDGIIVTNHHVIAGADEITVALRDRREFQAQLVGSDERTDLAVLRIGAGGEPLPVVAFRDSDEVEVGDLVLAIGNPFGVGQTVTSGIVSAQAQTRVGIRDLNFFIQTDAAINPGNSGGALVDMTGRLIGINTAIYSNSGGSLGIGFAIPSNMVRSVLAGVVSGGRLVRPWLGAWGKALTAEIAESLGMARPAGVLIDDVYPGGPADGAGLRVGDVVVALGDHAVDGPEALDYRLATQEVGTAATLRLWRRGQTLELDVALPAPPEVPTRDTSTLAGSHPLAGAVIANLSPAVAEEMGLKHYRSGAIVTAFARGAPARRVGFQIGDRILSVNGKTIGSVQDLKRGLGTNARRWQITLQRGGETITWLFQ